MIKSFKANNKHYYCKTEQKGWSQWSCRHEYGLETWASVHVSSYKLKRKDVIDAINVVDERSNGG